MTIDLATIPAERLALLETAVIYGGSHEGSGGPGCKHCARELLHEVVTGEHRDATPAGCTALMAVLPLLNDGPWRDDAHRTDVMRPYLRKLLALDPARDEERIYAIIDHVCRSILPESCDALGLAKEGSILRALAPIIDRRSGGAALAAIAGLDAIAALEAIAARAAFVDIAALGALTALADFDIAAQGPFDARAAVVALDGLYARAARAVLVALTALSALSALSGRGARAARAARADAWECGTRALLDRICSI